ncbi:MAG: response regulator [bacterium]|nr:MAG: response regulator [bacterium]
MKIPKAIIQSLDSEMITLCQNAAKDIGMKMVKRNDLANFLLDLQENDYQVVLFDCKSMQVDCLNWIKVLRRTRPKIPLIIISDEVDREMGGRVYEEGTFYLCVPPIQKELLQNIISAALTTYESRGRDQFRKTE